MSGVFELAICDAPKESVGAHREISILEAGFVEWMVNICRDQLLCPCVSLKGDKYCRVGGWSYILRLSQRYRTS